MGEAPGAGMLEDMMITEILMPVLIAAGVLLVALCALVPPLVDTH